MAIKRLKSSIDIVEAAKLRVRNIFRNGLPVYFSFSGGKDSLALAQVVLSLAQAGEIDLHQMVVQFIDEEAIFPCIEEMVMKWRRIFMSYGARFDWFCLEVRHFNCFNQLANDESFICWDSRKQDVWIRKPPSFAVRTHPKLRPRQDTYQSFLARANTDGISIVGVRMSESVQRLQYIASMTRAGRSITSQLKAFPIYDWNNNDVWLYLRNDKPPSATCGNVNPTSTSGTIIRHADSASMNISNSAKTSVLNHSPCWQQAFLAKTRGKAATVSKVASPSRKT